MTENSQKAFANTVELRQTHKEMVFEALKTENNQSRFEIGRKTGLGDIEGQRRLSDLFNEGEIVITGSRKHFDQEVSLYSVKDQLELYPIEKKPTLVRWLKNNYPDVLNEYKKL